MPVVVRQVADDRELLELALVENLQRSDLNPIEEAEAYAALQEKFGLSQEEVADRVGKARTTVTNVAAPPAPAGRGARPAARGAAHRRPGAPAARPAGIRRSRSGSPTSAVRDGLSARDLERLAAAPGRSARNPKKPDRPVEVHTAAAEERLTRRLQTRVEIKRQGKGGQLQASTSTRRRS